MGVKGRRKDGEEKGVGWEGEEDMVVGREGDMKVMLW